MAEFDDTDSREGLHINSAYCYTWLENKKAEQLEWKKGRRSEY